MKDINLRRYAPIAGSNGMYACLQSEDGTLHGAVYLTRCRNTGEYKVGASESPYARLRALAVQARRQWKREVGYIWSIVTNHIDRLEKYWLRRWRDYRVKDARREWFVLPDSEAAAFRWAATVAYRDLPPIPVEVREGLAAFQPEEIPSFLRPRRRAAR